MPRVAKRTARKDYPDAGISKGDEYYYWKIKLNRGGLVRRSKTYPKRSQLTLSDFFGPAYDLDDAIAEAEDADTLRSLAEEVRSLGEEQQEKLDNMPESLQSSPTGETIQERIDNCEEWASAIEQAADGLEQALSDIDDEDDDGDHEGDRDEALQTARDEAAMSF